ncbi:FAD-dependent monooxygenase [Actinophytocola oryzae]|uniref:2-polyprenyl-6-methoxyphenol hydroxylase-like FAD-dependent oxidoreductase n=1 Tax=Actinophytocola oryzae TaxID=502181 RepID=A0A4R7VAP9_9PSEU|nr:FAD-dependent monooxygenase [Actinophytocola oryzae]TDV46049.1 2-polyprenyl-6-methoxyphenol hydroxylase-like FAD-dependent oxidoreductase [Actinophytocola oryzae]
MSYDVIISGAGPTGLMLACELRLHDVSVLVLERLPEPDLTVKAGSVNVPAAEAFYRRGLLPRLAAAQEQNMGMFRAFMKDRAKDAAPPPRFAGHFAALSLSGNNLDESDPELNGHGPVDRIGFVTQAQLEAILLERAVELGAEVRKGVEVTGFDTGEQVSVHTSAGTVEAGWLVGCDGGRGTVRKLAGFEFPGTPPEITGHQAMVEMTGAEGLGLGWITTPTGIYAHGPMPGRVLTVEFDGPPEYRDTPVTPGELEESIRAVSGVDVTITKVNSATRFTDNARQATTYRLGRVLLAGDAAHVHSPFGGQGLNLGVGDAVNLGWKLAAVVDKRLPEEVLDTYTSERHPIGAWVLEWTRAQIALMRPDSHARALRAVVADLVDTTAGTTYFVKKISGVWQSYDLPGDHPWVGRSAPDLELGDGTRLGDHLHDGRGLLLDLGGLPTTVADAVRTTCPEHPELPGLLVRPDGIVAWAGGDHLAEALTKWFGETTRH